MVRWTHARRRRVPEVTCGSDVNWSGIICVRACERPTMGRGPDCVRVRCARPLSALLELPIPEKSENVFAYREVTFILDCGYRVPSKFAKFIIEAITLEGKKRGKQNPARFFCRVGCLKPNCKCQAAFGYKGLIELDHSSVLQYRWLSCFIGIEDCIQVTYAMNII